MSLFARMKAVLMKKDKGGKEIIVEIGIAVIAVALLLIFRTQISTLITNIMGQATTQITNLFTMGS